ncbi:hypothetical protein [Blastopirellula retiformator]|uniref:Uncharacterized protein n=1 Tax=Blastopirellula retiformator TaxID=2527970 RepID=A0A5C5VLH4_9BACT|nr:hypothetical protein [Blastopirellula retiformator]TWT38695.1 hypothetical protein Enr8_03890 [Blastopirellula retiformator]
MEEQENYKRLLVALEAWPQMNLPAFTVYRRLWDALGAEPGSIDIAVTQDAGKYHLTPQSLRRALAKLESIGLVKREMAFEDEFQVKQIRYAVYDALAIRERPNATRAEVKVTQATQSAAPKVARAPISDPAPESAPISKSVPAPKVALAPESVSAPNSALPPPGGANQERHESCATPDDHKQPAESEASRPMEIPPGGAQEQENKKLSPTSISNSRTKSTQVQEPRPSPARTGPPDVPIARADDDWSEFGDAKPLAAAIEKFAEQLEDPAKIERQRERRIQALATKILRSIRTAEDLCGTRESDLMDRSVAEKAAAWWHELETNQAGDGHDRQVIAKQFENVLRRIDQLGRERSLKKPGAYLNTSIGKIVAKAGGVWAEPKPEF